MNDPAGKTWIVRNLDKWIQECIVQVQHLKQTIIKIYLKNTVQLSWVTNMNLFWFCRLSISTKCTGV
eukprot:TRINITY_DN7056_c0_g1_i1.p2 TRINITY_DN7056_c0_g1~~TRINITY_DN7056_c0_g1_i1.p2  ORF type:complete len:67 (-),score=4.24 TRINITY_DN7056_c0_g1_i1:438-638(-)